MVESFGIPSTREIAAKSEGARVLPFGQVAALNETATKSGSRMAFVTLEDMVGTVEITVFPEPFKAAAEHLRGRQPVLVRGRIDDADKGRVVLADDIRPLEAALPAHRRRARDRKSTRLNSSHDQISYAVFCLKKKKNTD